jgi:hypothetical protein
MKNTPLHTTFTKTNVPAWMCPECGNKTLNIQNGTFKSMQTKATRDLNDHEDWEIGWDNYVYSCIFECSRPDCGEVVASSGYGFVEEDYDPEAHEKIRQVVYRAEHFTPTLSVFGIPTSCPESVRLPLQLSFSLHLTNPGAAANSIRIAIEELLTQIDVPLTHTIKNGINAGKTKNSTLGERLLQLKIDGKHPDFVDKLTAIKGFGNAGSHKVSDVELTDVDDAFEIVEWILNKLFDDREEKVKALTDKMVQRFKRP